MRSLGHAPGGLKHFARVGEYVKYRTDLPERLRELTILTSAREVPYAWAAGGARLAAGKKVTISDVVTPRDRSPG